MKMNTFEIRSDDAFIIVDPQNDFMPGGALAVTGGDEIIADINILLPMFARSSAAVVITQDWHPQGHKSFASNHGVEPFSMVQLSYGDQVAWPDHCVQSSTGAEFHNMLGAGYADVIIRKGMNPELDSYSAFYENDKTTPTGLAGYLRDKGVKRCVFVGLAYDFCVGYSALDARREGFDAVILKGMTRAIDMNGSVAAIEAEFEKAGVIVNG
jgi:nicotinamidase/pyrazinamidase